MALGSWSKAEFEYGKKVLNSGLEGARSGKDTFLRGERLSPFLNETARNALKPAAVGAVVGMLSSFGKSKNRSVTRILSRGALGSFIGFLSGVAWGSRVLTTSVAKSARKNIDKIRDEHWLQKHPIDYA